MWQRLSIDPALLLGLLVLMAIGAVLLFSASGQSEAVITRQAVRFAVALV